MKDRMLKLISIIIVVILIFIPLNAVPEVILKGISAAIFLGFFIYSYLSKGKALPRIIKILSILSFAININLIKFRLMDYETAAASGDGNVILSFITILVLLTSQVFIAQKGCRRAAEMAARFSLDRSNIKRFEIDDKLKQGLITKDEEENLKESLRQKIDFYSCMDCACKFLSGVSKANVFITLVNLVGAMRLQTIRFESPLLPAVEKAVVITAQNVIVFTVPVIIMGIFSMLRLVKEWEKGE